MKTVSLRKQILIVMLSVILGMFAINSFAQFGGGDGSEANPWAIETAEHLNNVRNFIGAANADKHFKLTSDIDLGVEPWNEGEGWIPIGPTSANSFRGTFDGNGYVIKNLTINRNTTYQGLFGHTNGSGVIRNLGLIDANIVGGTHVGGILSYTNSNSKVERCYVTGKVQGACYVGGIVGTHGTGAGTRIEDCYSAANIVCTGPNPGMYAAGIVSLQYGGQVNRCYSIGRVEMISETEYVGAIVANKGANALVNNVYWDTYTVGQERGVGSIEDAHFGSTTAQMMREGTFQGFDFTNVWDIRDGRSYPFLRCQGDEPHPYNYPFLPASNLDSTAGNGFIELNWNSPPQDIVIPLPIGYNVYRDDERINEELVTELRYLDEDVENWITYTYFVIAIYNNGESVPTVSVVATPVNFAGGDGTAENPYRVETADHLDNIRHPINVHFIQTADINLGVAPWSMGTGWNPIGDDEKKFNSHYNGNGFIINGLTIDTNVRYSGLFGFAHQASFSNIILEDVNVRVGQDGGTLAGRATESDFKKCSSQGVLNGTGNDVGGLIGYFSGTMSDCYSSVNVNATGKDHVGGLIGDSWGSGIRCWATGDVIGRNFVGGLAGREYNGRPAFQQSYATGNVRGTNDVGGLFGLIKTANYSDVFATGDVVGTARVGGLIGNIDHNSCVVENSYSIGRVTGNTLVGGLTGRAIAGSIVENSYWNITTSEQGASSRGLGRNTDQMVYPYVDDLETYVEWDFEEVWAHDINRTYNGGYPVFQFMVEPAQPIDAPQIKVDIVQIEGVNHFRIRWELVDGARSYKIFASEESAPDNWGAPVRVVEEDVTYYTEPVGENKRKFFHIVASRQETR